MTPEERGLKKVSSYEYGFDESGLNKLIFNEKKVNLVFDNDSFQINRIRTTLDRFIWFLQTSERGYKEMICPVYLLEGNFKERNSKIKGVIRPRLIIADNSPRIIPTLPPEFHFYIYRTDLFISKINSKNKIGVSIELEKSNLVCMISDFRYISEDKIGSAFYVKPRKESKEVYFSP